jgi:hypothetical protein
MRVLAIAAVLMLPGLAPPSLAAAAPADRGWGLWIQQGDRAIPLGDVRTAFAGPPAARAPSIQAGYGWRGAGGGLAAVVGYDQPQGERRDAYAPISNARYPGAPTADAPGVMGLSFSMRLR